MNGKTKLGLGVAAAALVAGGAYIGSWIFAPQGLPGDGWPTPDNSQGKKHGGNPKSYINCREPGSQGNVSIEAAKKRGFCKANEFNPTHFSVVFLEFGNGVNSPRFKAKQLHFKTRPVGQGTNNIFENNDDLTCAIEFVRAGSPPASCENVAYPNNDNPDIRINFEDFNYNSQQRTYVVVDRNVARFFEKAPMSFTPFGASDDPFKDLPKFKATRARNKSFGGADTQQVDGYEVLLFENYFKNGRGGELGAGESVKFSINFNLLLCSKPASEECDFSNKGEVIPIIVDPDTNNGLGLP